MQYPKRSQLLICTSVVAALLAAPAIAGAAGLCLQATDGRQYILNKVSPKFASAKAKPFGGVSVAAGYVRPLSGVATRNSDGIIFSLAFTLYKADVSSNGWSVAGSTQFHQIAIYDADGSWDVGQTTSDCLWGDGVEVVVPICTGVTAIDCSTIVLP